MHKASTQIPLLKCTAGPQGAFPSWRLHFSVLWDEPVQRILTGVHFLTGLGLGGGVGGDPTALELQSLPRWGTQPTVTPVSLPGSASLFPVFHSQNAVQKGVKIKLNPLYFFVYYYSDFLEIHSLSGCRIPPAHQQAAQSSTANVHLPKTKHG